MNSLLPIGIVAAYVGLLLVGLVLWRTISARRRAKLSGSEPPPRGGQIPAKVSFAEFCAQRAQKESAKETAAHAQFRRPA